MYQFGTVKKKDGRNVTIREFELFGIIVFVWFFFVFFFWFGWLGFFLWGSFTLELNVLFIFKSLLCSSVLFWGFG